MDSPPSGTPRAGPRWSSSRRDDRGGGAATRRRARLPVQSLAALLVLVGADACSTTYQPRQTGRVNVVIHHAAAMYAKDGRELPIGPFSGELEGLVSDTPAAAVHARRAHTQFMIGIPTYLTGAAGVIVGVVVLSGPVGWVVVGIGVSTLGTGLGFMGAGFTHAVDAVNIHNDAVCDPRAPPAAPSPKP